MGQPHCPIIEHPVIGCDLQSRYPTPFDDCDDRHATLQVHRETPATIPCW